MSNFGPMAGQGQLRIPTPPRGEPIARYDTYLEAQRAVDFLSDNHFPVQFVTIVGSGLRMVERVTGRLSYPRVAAAGAATGAWFGLFVGLLLSLFGNGAPGGAVIGAVLIGAAFGVLFGITSYTLTGGRRDFTSTSQIVASEYEVLCLAEQAPAARDLLFRLPGPTGRGPWGSTPPPPPPAPSHPSNAPSSWPPPQPPATPEHGEQPITGPTYGEMIEKQRLERLERERLERERQQAEREREREREERQEPPPPSSS